MKRLTQSPPYVLEIKRQWRIVIPIRGKLAPKIVPTEFPSRADAETWLASEEGERAVAQYRGPYRM